MNDSIAFRLICQRNREPRFRLTAYRMGLGLANDLFFCYLFHIMAEITTGSLWRLRRQYLHQKAQGRNDRKWLLGKRKDPEGNIIRARPGETGTSARETGTPSISRKTLGGWRVHLPSLISIRWACLMVLKKVDQKDHPNNNPLKPLSGRSIGDHFEWKRACRYIAGRTDRRDQEACTLSRTSSWPRSHPCRR